MMLNWLKILTELQKALPNHDGPFRVAVYMRSDLMVHQAATAIRHIESLEKEVNAQSKFVLVGTYTDFGTSLCTLADRQGLMDLLTATTNGEVDLILTNSVTRLARKPETMMELGDILVKAPQPVAVVMQRELTMVFAENIRVWTEKVARGEVTPCQGIIVSTTHIFPDHFGI